MGAKNKIERYIKQWEQKGYSNGIPDDAPSELEKRGLVPSYRMICITLMRNPYNLEKLGIAREKCKIYSDLKRAELIRKGKLKNDNQLKINFYEKER